MEDYVRMLVEEEFNPDCLVEALRKIIRDELNYVYLARLILEKVDLDDIATEIAAENLDLPF